MRDIDLIPVRYERRRRFNLWGRRALVAFVLVGCSTLASRLALNEWNSTYTDEIATLEREQMRLQADEEAIVRLGAERDRLSRRLAVLEEIRGDGVATEMFRVLDESLDEHVLFDRWTFRRADEIVDDRRATSEVGYFIVLPKDDVDEPERAWRRFTHMEILAEAEDHTSLAAFVRRLGQRPEIAQTRILNTRSHAKRGHSSVGFEIAVTVGAGQ